MGRSCEEQPGGSLSERKTTKSDSSWMRGVPTLSSMARRVLSWSPQKDVNVEYVDGARVDGNSWITTEEVGEEAVSEVVHQALLLRDRRRPMVPSLYRDKPTHPLVCFKPGHRHSTRQPSAGDLGSPRDAIELFLIMRERETMTSEPLVCVCVKSHMQQGASPPNQLHKSERGQQVAPSLTFRTRGLQRLWSTRACVQFRTSVFTQLVPCPEMLQKPLRKVFLLDTDDIVP